MKKEKMPKVAVVFFAILLSLAFVSMKTAFDVYTDYQKKKDTLQK